MREKYRMTHGDGALDLIIGGNDISLQMGSGVSVSESRRGWIIHTTIPRNEVNCQCTSTTK